MLKELFLIPVWLLAKLPGTSRGYRQDKKMLSMSLRTFASTKWTKPAVVCVASGLLWFIFYQILKELVQKLYN